MSYGQKSDFQHGSRRHLKYQKYKFLVTRLSSGSISAVVYQISSKSDDFSLIYSDLTIFKNGGRPPSWILIYFLFCYVAFVGMQFCFLIQNLAEIGQSVDEL